MKKDLKIIIQKEQEKNRIDKVLMGSDIIKDLNITRNQLQEFIKSGNLRKGCDIITNSSYKVKVGDIFELLIPEIIEKKLQPSNIPLDIIYEDNDLIVINKQAGLTTHPGAGNDENTLANALLNIYGKEKLSKIGGEFRPGILHRLDKDTSGLMIVAKNDEAHLKLSQQLQTRELKRYYIAFLWGVITPLNGNIEGYMERSKTNRLKMEIVDNPEARYSLTHYKTLKTFLNNSISKVEFNLETGRTHQIRLHSSYIKHPLIGDLIYGGKTRHLKNEYGQEIKNIVDTFPRQALHSYKIKFYQPTTNELKQFEVPLPKDMQNLENILIKP